MDKHACTLQSWRYQLAEKVVGGTEKKKIPAHYINQIKDKAEDIDAQIETIMFTEDIRNADN